MLPDLGLDQLASMGFELRKGPFLICAHEPTVAGHVGGQDGYQLTFGALHRHGVAPSLGDQYITV
jgi:hypothetical protein